MLDDDVAGLSPAKRLQSLPKGDDARQHFGIALGVWMQECDATQTLALRRRRPGGGQRTRKQSQEFASLQSIKSHSVSRQPDGSQDIELASASQQACRIADGPARPNPGAATPINHLADGMPAARPLASTEAGNHTCQGSGINAY